MEAVRDFFQNFDFQEFVESLRWENLKRDKRKMFVLIMVLLVALTVLGSIVANFTYLSSDEEDRLYIAVVGPMSGEAAVNGESLRQGAELYAELINEEGGVNGGEVVVMVKDDANDPAKAVQIANEIVTDSKAIAVIGHWTNETSKAAGEVYRQHKLPVIMPAPGAPAVFDGNPYYFPALYDDSVETAFVANYTRNVLGQKTASIIHDISETGTQMAKGFEETYGRFGTRIRYKWGFDSKSTDLDTRLAAISTELKGKLDAGTVFIAADENTVARVLKAMRAAKARNRVVGTSVLATRAFRRAVGKHPEDVAPLINKIVASTPLLLDTANEEAQNFNSRYQSKFGSPSDWVAAYAYDTVHAIVEAFKRGQRKDGEDLLVGNRRVVWEGLKSATRPSGAIRGVTGVRIFAKSFDQTPEQIEASKKRRRLTTPVLMGQYDGISMVSALTQLQPIKPGVGGNYIEELKKGKVLYVNDRFMYKTNVVYTGFQLNEISELDSEAGTATLDFIVWFRYRGKFEPQSLLFDNAVDPIKLGKPIEEQVSRGLNYKLYRIKAKFKYDFSPVPRPYGTLLLGFDVRHQTLNRNNLQYVVDVIGIGLDKGATFQDILERRQVLSSKLGWDVDKAWISQEIIETGTQGDPSYVGHGTVDPKFSRITLGVLISESQISARDFIPEKYFVYLAIFGFLGTVFAVLMDRKKHGRFWSVQSWFLRVMSWPFLLLAAGNLLLDFAVLNIPTSYVDMIVLGYDVLWWVMPARLTGIALERFLWIPLEEHTRRMVPNVIRMFGSFNVYILAGFGIIAFTFDQKITSLLATSGLLAMIIGLAIQANISNVFSGIAINVERPFVVGDWVKIGDLEEGEVIDITWRTIRIKTRGGYTISMPNAQASESAVHNFTSSKAMRLSMQLNVDPDADPRVVQELLVEALKSSEGVMKEPQPAVRYNGTVDGYNDWGGEFSVQFWIGNYAMKETISSEVWNNVWAALDLADLDVKTGDGTPVSADVAPQAQPAE